MPSRTALRIARGLLDLDADPEVRAVLPEGTGEVVRALLAGAGVRHQPASPLRRRLEARLFPGAALHFALRKAWVDAVVVDALGAGAEQVLVVGAGLDPLAVRLASRWPGATFVELDRPETSAVKASGVAAADLGRPNLHLVGRDLRVSSLAEVLPASWRRDAPSVVVAEGVLMYLDEDAVGELLRGVAQAVAAGSRFAFTFLAARDDGRHPVPGPLRWALTAFGEPLRWVVAPAALDALVQRHGHRLVEQPGTADLRARFLAGHGLQGAPLADRERFAVSRTERSSPS